MVKYVYDARGNHSVLNPDGTKNTSSTFIGNLNPFRYRGYYYDTETGLYYLKTRYYDPEVGRFITIDDISYLSPDIINGLNLYAYCNNNPVMNIDPEGTKWWHWLIGIGIAVAVIGLSIMTAGAIISVAPAVANFASVMVMGFTGSTALAGVAATAVSVGAAVLAGANIIIGINEGICALTGFNALGTLMGDEAYGVVRDTVGITSAIFMAAGASLPYPSTGDGTPQNLKEQMAMSSDPKAGKAIERIKMSDPRMPNWLGWQKYEQVIPLSNGKIIIHYVGNRFFPNWYFLKPWFDFKFKRN